MIKIAICDDDTRFLEFLKNYLLDNLKLNISVHIFSSPFELLDNIQEYDVLFLDYELPYINGIKVLDTIKEISILKIMISNYSHISFNTYQYKIFWFVRKHYIDYDLSMLLPHLTNELINNKIKKFNISSSNKYLMLDFKSINYIETQSNYLIIHTNQKNYKIRSSFKAISEQFNNLLFIIPVYGAIINIEYIEYIDLHQDIVQLKNGIIFPISRSKKRGVVETYARYNNYY